MPRIATALCAAAMLLASTLPARTAEQRIALVIGNGAYVDVPGLPNAVADATLMVETLRELGFEVIERIDATQREMKKAIKTFGGKLSVAGDEGVGLFYYAGHGVQADGVNYLIPIGAEIADEIDLDIEAVSANAVLGKMEYAGSALNFVILDACRNNPYAGGFRSVGRGLARMLAPSGSLVSYATAPGGVAADGTGANSPYTAALTRAMAIPGLPVEQVFKQVRRDVLAATDNAQTTWESSSLTGDFYFVPAVEVVEEPAAPAPSTPQAVPATQPGDMGDSALDLAFWDAIKNSTNPSSFRTYLDQFPEGVFAGLAALRIEELMQAEQEVASLPPATETPDFVVEEMEAPYRVLTRANLRAGPSADFERVGQLDSGAEITVTGRVEGQNWFRIASADGVQGFIFGELIQREAAYQLALTAAQAAREEEAAQAAREEEEAARELAALTPATPGFEIVEMEAPYRVLASANLRAGPSADYESVGRLDADTEITVTGRVEGQNWFRVASAGGVQGFIFGDLIQKEASYQLALAATQTVLEAEDTAPSTGLDAEAMASNRDAVVQGFSGDFNRQLANVLPSFGMGEYCSNISMRFEDDIIIQSASCNFVGKYGQAKGECDIFAITGIDITYNEGEDNWTVNMDAGGYNCKVKNKISNVNTPGEYKTEAIFFKMLSEAEANSLRDIVARYVFIKTGKIIVDQTESGAVLAGLR